MYSNYEDCITSFVNTNINDWTFKSNPEYCLVLEHVKPRQGELYINELKKRFDVLYNSNTDYLIELCRLNDSCGKPKKYNFKNFTDCSPTGLRYIFQSFLILTYMKECNLNNIDVIEIGGGYGGLCFFIYKLAHLFDITINTYSIFDLQMPLILQQKYLENLSIHNINYVTLDNMKNLKYNSFLISNYAFSEISLDLQKQYTNHVLNPYVSYGFLAWNFIDVYEFIDNKNITIEAEYPLTYRTNKYVRFSPK